MCTVKFNKQHLELLLRGPSLSFGSGIPSSQVGQNFPINTLEGNVPTLRAEKTIYKTQTILRISVFASELILSVRELGRF